MRRRMRELLVVTLALTAPAAVMAGCGGGGGGKSGAASSPAGGAETTGGGASGARSGGTLTIGLAEPIDTLDPLTSISLPTFQVIPSVFDTLLTVAPDGSIKPSLATKFDYEPEQRRIRFELDPKAKFSNGKPVTASDVAFSVNKWRKGTTYGSYYKSIAGVDVEDERTVTLRLKSPNAGLLGVLAINTASVFPKDFAGKTEKEFFRKPIGSGPFAISSVDPGREISLTRNTNYRTEGQPLADKVVFKVITDVNQQILQFKSGKLDIVNSIGGSDAPQFPAEALKSGPSFSQDIVLSNVKAPALKSAALRQAISKALDRKKLIEGGFNGKAVLPTAVEPQAIPGVQPCSACDWASMDVAGAKKLVGEAGYDGKPIELLVSSSGGSEKLVAQAMQPMLAAAGIQIKITTVDSATLENRLTKMDYELILLNNSALGATPLDPLGFLATTENYFTGSDVKVIKEALADVEAAKSTEELQAASEKYETWAFSDAAIIPVVSLEGTYAVAKDVVGFQPPLSPGYSLAAVGRSG